MMSILHIIDLSHCSLEIPWTLLLLPIQLRAVALEYGQ